MMMKRIRYALIGFGGIAENRIAKEGFACDTSRFSPLACAELAGATDMNPARKSAAKALKLQWYDSLDDILADKSIDGVFIATNNASHAAVATRCLEAGKHVIVEKPAATSVAEAGAMVTLAAEHGLSIAVDHMMINNAWNVKAKECVAGGMLGKVNDSCFHMEFAYGYDPAEAASWRCSKVEEMGGPVGDVASHCFYVAEFIFGKRINKVAAVYYPKIMDIKSEDGAYIKFFFEDGTGGSIRAAFSELRGGPGGTFSNLGFELYGSKSVLRSFGSMFQYSGHKDEPYSIRLELDEGGRVTEIPPAPIVNIYQALIIKHAESIINASPLNAEDAVHNLQLCAACHESAQNGGKTVDIN